MNEMSIVQAVLAESEELPPIAAAGYEYVVAANGLFIRADDSRMEACVPCTPIGVVSLHGLADVEPYARLKLPRVDASLLWAIQQSAYRRLPNEAMYQIYRDGVIWRCRMPKQVAGPVSLAFEDDGRTVVDLHSHGTLEAFFSETDDGDELGLRFYAVIGRLDHDWPEIRVRAGVYGHHWDVPAGSIFDVEEGGPFVDRFFQDDEDEHGESLDL